METGPPTFIGPKSGQETAQLNNNILRMQNTFCDQATASGSDPGPKPAATLGDKKEKDTCIPTRKEEEREVEGLNNFAAVVAAAQAAMAESCTVKNRRPSTAKCSPKSGMVENPLPETSWLDLDDSGNDV